MNDMTWKTSSYSGDTSLCVEVGWHTSSYTGPDAVAVRDTKDRGRGSLSFHAPVWTVFLDSLPRV